MDIVALQQIRGSNSESITVDKYTILYSGSIDGRHEFGTGFAVKEHLRNLIISFKPINERLCYIRMKGKWRNYSLLAVHAPTEKKEDDIKDEFYEELENTINEIPKQDMLIILGEFNAKIGKEPACGTAQSTYRIER